MLAADMLNFVKFRLGFTLIVDANSVIDLFGVLGAFGVVDTPPIRLGAVPLLTGGSGRTSPSLNDVADRGLLAPTPVGSSIAFPVSSLAPTSLMKMPNICCGRSFAMAAYSSRSCSPVSPMRINRESGKFSRISRMLERLRVAGAESRPLKRERPAYDFSRTDPGTWGC